MLNKELGKSSYGMVVRCLSSKQKQTNKKVFDTKSGKSFKFSASVLYNPILASWTTAFTRSVIGECLKNIEKLGGKIVSVTTDGFSTNIQDLENKLLTLKPEEIYLFSKYMGLRKTLSGNPESLELKHHGLGIISWSIRGQLGVGSSIKATTGFQIGWLRTTWIVTQFKETLKSSNKSFGYTRSSLRSAKDIFKKGAHVTRTLRDKKLESNHAG